jgi:hypothetical protein
MEVWFCAKGAGTCAVRHNALTVNRGSELTNGNIVFPSEPPVAKRRNARTVLARKGSLRRAKPARPCALRSVLTDSEMRRAAPVGTRFTRTIMLHDAKEGGTSVSPLTRLIMEVPRK